MECGRCDNSGMSAEAYAELGSRARAATHQLRDSIRAAIGHATLAEQQRSDRLARERAGAPALYPGSYDSYDSDENEIPHLFEEDAETAMFNACNEALDGIAKMDAFKSVVRAAAGPRQHR